jgi:MFS superfamily sulfate permease-like transporter
VLAAGVLRGVVVAVLISLLVLLHELNHPRIVAAAPVPGLLVVRPEERLYFANARRVRERITAIVAAEQPPPRAVLLDLGAVNSLEVTALDQLAGLAEDLQGRGMNLWMAVPGQQPLEVVRRAAELLGRTSLEAGTGRLGVRVFARVEDAVSAHQGS